MTLQNDLAALVDPNHLGNIVNVTAPNGAQDGEITINSAQVPSFVTNFDTGLPLLENVQTYISGALHDLSSKIQINVDLTYSVNLFFNFQNGNVILDANPNTTTDPLVSLNLQAQPQSPISYQTNLGPIVVQAGEGTEEGPNGFQLNFKGMAFNLLTPTGAIGGSYDTSGSLNFTGADSQVVFANGASGIIDLALTVDMNPSYPQGSNMNPFPSLEADLDINWHPAAGSGSVAGETDPFDHIQPDLSINFGVWINLSNVIGFINPIVSEIRDKVSPLANVVAEIHHVLFDPIPILSDLIPGVTLAGILENPVIDAEAGAAVTGLGDFAQAVQDINAILNWTTQTLSALTTPIELASINILDDDPRTDPNFNLTTVVNNLASTAVTFVDTSDVNNFLSGLNGPNGLLPGLQIPLLTDPLTDLKALLGDNVVLVQYSLPPSFAYPGLVFGENITIPIFPPLDLVLSFNLTIAGALTVGYDTYGFTTAAPNVAGWNGDPSVPIAPDPTNNSAFQNLPVISASPQVFEGIFVQNASLVLIGGVGLTAEVNVADIITGGGTGTIKLQFGIGGQAVPPQGLKETQLDVPTNNIWPDPSGQHPFHTVTFQGNPENVLQLGDFVWDIIDEQGGALCPLNVGGALYLDFSVFLTIGIGPFSYTISHDFGTVTLADFTVNTCNASVKPQLAGYDTYNGDNTQLSNWLTSSAQQQGITVPALPDFATAFNGVDSKYFLKTFPGTQTVVLLNVGEYQGFRNVGQNQPEDLEVSPFPDPQGPAGNLNDLLVQGFDQVTIIPNANFNTTTIVAVGDPNATFSSSSSPYTPITPEPLTITIDKGVHANAYLQGGMETNSFNYQGDGDTYMIGGDENDPTLGNTTSTQNTLTGGSGDNFLQGGSDNTSGSGGNSLLAFDPAWNFLNGGSGPNVLQAAGAGATLKAGPNPDVLIGGSGAGEPLEPTYDFVAGPSLFDYLQGGALSENQFEWNESDGSLDVVGTPGAANVLALEADTPDETWTFNQIANPSSPLDTIQIIPGTASKVIDAVGLQALSVDDSPLTINPSPPYQETYPLGSEITYLVNDLSSTGIKRVELNQHEQNTPDVYSDKVIVNVPNTTPNVLVNAVGPAGALPDGDEVFLGANGSSTGTIYEVAAALPKTDDSLTINALGGGDTVTVGSTQQGTVDINTNAGSTGTGGNTINVYETGGQLGIDAGGYDTVTIGQYGIQEVQGQGLFTGAGLALIQGLVTVTGVANQASLILDSRAAGSASPTITVNTTYVQGLRPPTSITSPSTRSPSTAKSHSRPPARRSTSRAQAPRFSTRRASSLA